MSEFKVGDVVRCVDNDCMENILREGCMYTVSRVDRDRLNFLEMDGFIYDFNERRFELFMRDGTGTPQPSKFNASGSKYLRDIQTTPDGKIDVYAVLIAFNVVSPARQHAIKKLLCAGIRGKNNEINDIEEARDAIERDIELMKNN